MSAAGNRPVAVVTGGSRGIGAAVAEALARDGYDLIISYASRPDAARAVAAACETHGATALTVQADFTDPGPASERVFREVDNLGRGLDVLVNNAGVLPPSGPLHAASAERILSTLTVNTAGPALCAGQAVQRMRRSAGGRGGVILNVSSRAAQRGGAGEFVDYAMSKAAIDILTRGLSDEVAPDGIRVVGVRPGLIDTDMNAAVPGRLDALKSTIPLGRIGTPEEVAEVIAWLVSPSAAYITGVTLDVSGGR